MKPLKKFFCHELVKGYVRQGKESVCEKAFSINFSQTNPPRKADVL
jgi:hypothetical protein